MLLVASTSRADSIDWTSIVEDMSTSMESRMREHQIPGGVLVIVRSDEVVLSKGFGLANVETETPVDASSTLFRVASLSKPFTALAAAQLAEQDQLDLDADIERILGNVSPQRSFDEPITTRHLLTHTAGFDNSDAGDAARTSAEAIPLETYIQHHMTSQTTRPGQHCRYSNQGFALAGLVIERSSGVAFADYMRDAIFTPLGMTNATFMQPTPEQNPQIAVGYELTDSGVAPLAYDYSNVAPADALLATGDDLAQFLILQLGNHPNGARIISDRGRHETQRHQFSHTDSPPSMALGWNRVQRYGERAMLEHSGGQLGFTSYMTVFPEDDIGFFIALNRRDFRARVGVLQDFATRYLPPREFTAPSRVPASRDLNLYQGTFRGTDYPRDDILRSVAVLGLIGDRVEVAADGSDLIIDGNRCVPTGPDTFERDSGSRIYRFDAEQSGPDMLYMGKESYERERFYQSPLVVLGALVLVMAVSIARGILFPIWRRIRKTDATSLNHSTRFLTGVHFSVAVAVILFQTLMIQIAMQDGMDYGAPWILTPLTWIATVAVTLVPIGWLLAVGGLLHHKPTKSLGWLEFALATSILPCVWLFTEMQLTFWA